MKNIHILPTDKKPIKGDLLLRHLWRGTSNECISWWRYNETITIDDVIQYTTLNGSFRDITSSFKTHNIYITSDEEIKEEFLTKEIYVIDIQNGNIGKLTCKNNFFKGSSKLIEIEWKNKQNIWNYCYIREIILTTDQDLDGVQAIDDEFLEWFVNNPSCEEVKTYYIPNEFRYEIIIPKEEPKQGSMSEAVKQAITDIIKSDEELGLYDEPKVQEINPYIGPFLLNNGFVKQENNIYATPECTTIIVTKDYYEVQFIKPDLGEVSMYTDSLSVYHLVGILTWFNLIDKNYKK